jgi:hypothetical protein
LTQSKPKPNSLYKYNTYITEHAGKQVSKLDQTKKKLIPSVKRRGFIIMLIK